jgi:hypothetical protein
LLAADTVRGSIAIALLMLGCHPAKSELSVTAPTRLGGLESAQPKNRYVVVANGTPLFEKPGEDTPRGHLGSADEIGGWTMRQVDARDGFVAVQADIEDGVEHCAFTADGLTGLGITMWVPAHRLATVLVREVELEAEDCERLVARPGVMVTTLCEEDGGRRWRIGSCPNARCVYEVPADAIGHGYEASPRATTNVADEEGVPMPCVDGIDESGTRRPLTRDRSMGGLPATGLSRYGKDPEPGRLPACELSMTALFCGGEPRLGFDHVRYEVAAGTAITWRDGRPVGTTEAARELRAVPREVGERVCWGALEGDGADDDLELCADADAVRRIEDAHAVVLQLRQGDHTRPAWRDEEATACYRDALATTPDLKGRVRAKYRIANGTATLQSVDRPAAEAFARCVGTHFADERDEAYVLELVLEAFPAITDASSGGRPPARADAPHPARSRSPSDRRR